MATYAAIVSLMNNIEQIMNHPRLSNCFNKIQMESLLHKAGSLLEFIERYTVNHEEALEREIISAAEAAEDVVESHVVDQIHDGTIHFLDLRQLIQDMGAVAERAMEVMKKGEGEKEQSTYPHTQRVAADAESGGTTAMVGLEDESTQLLDSLTDNHIVSIVGMGGTGKTTLAQNLYANQLVKEHFDIRGWATISQQYSLPDILSHLVSCLGKFTTNGNVGELGEKLHKSLFDRRYLIVLDDIWSVEAWDAIRRFLPDDGNKSRVVLTTRLSNVASVMTDLE